MNLARIRARVADPLYHSKLSERFEFHMRHYFVAYDATRRVAVPHPHHARASFFLGMALSDKWDALEQWGLRPTRDGARA